MSSYEVIDGPERDEVVSGWRDRLRGESHLGAREALTRFMLILTFSNPNNEPELWENDKRRAKARQAADWPIKEVQRHTSADGTVRHHIKRARGKPLNR